MKGRLVTLGDSLWLRQRALVESVHDQLKHISPGERTRHRRPVNFLVNLLPGWMAYCHQPQRPSLRPRPSLPETAAYPYVG